MLAWGQTWAEVHRPEGKKGSTKCCQWKWNSGHLCLFLVGCSGLTSDILQSLRVSAEVTDGGPCVPLMPRCPIMPNSCVFLCVFGRIDVHVSPLSEAAVCDDVQKRLKPISDDSVSARFIFLESFSTLADLHMTFRQHYNLKMQFGAL